MYMNRPQAVGALLPAYEKKEEISLLVGLVKACAKRKDLIKGIRLHDDILAKGLLAKNPYLASALISMYAKCGVLSKAHQMLDELPIRNLASWNALIGGYLQQGQGHEALNCFQQMQSEGLSPNVVTLTCILKACARTGDIETGERTHKDVVSRGWLDKDIMLGNALVDMYAKCGKISKAHRVLKELPTRDTVTWSALIAGYTQQGQGHEALNCFEWMQNEGLSADVVTFTTLLKACSITGTIDKGKQIHDEIAAKGFLKKDVALGNALVDMYAKCGALERAKEVLKELPNHNVVSWSSLIAGYAQQQLGDEALKCFEQMQDEGLSPDAVTFTSVLNGCAGTKDIEKGKQIHVQVMYRGLIKRDVVLGNALVDMYAKCNALPEAQNVLEGLPIRNVVSWSALIVGYAQQDRGQEALDAFEKMQKEGFYPDAVTFVGILKACGNTWAIGKGEHIHEVIMSRKLLEKDTALGNALVDMYAKFGMLTKAKQVLEQLSRRDIVSWNALIAGYAQQGDGCAALACFHEIQNHGLTPDDVTFLSVLSACTHSGLLCEAQMVFQDITKKHGAIPTLEHHTCMVSVFGCVGNFDRALSMIKVMPSSDDIAVWLALLGACKKWGNVELGRLVFNQALQLDDTCSAAYALMASVFASAGLHEDAEKVEAMKLKYASGKEQGDFVRVDCTPKAKICGL